MDVDLGAGRGGKGTCLAGRQGKQDVGIIDCLLGLRIPRMGFVMQIDVAISQWH